MQVRRELSYTETVRRYAQEGWTDYCQKELSQALADPSTEVIPLFHPDYRQEDYAAQLRDLPEDISALAVSTGRTTQLTTTLARSTDSNALCGYRAQAQNAKAIGAPALFDKSIEVVHELIQRDIVRRFPQQWWALPQLEPDALTRQLSDSLLQLSGSRSAAAGRQPEPEPEPEPALKPKPELEPEPEPVSAAGPNPDTMWRLLEIGVAEMGARPLLLVARVY
jgi:hypothetical protein